MEVFFYSLQILQVFFVSVAEVGRREKLRRQGSHAILVVKVGASFQYATDHVTLRADLSWK